MGNPAGMKRLKREKRRAKFEKRLGVAAYVPKELQEEVKKAAAAFEAQERASLAERVAKSKERHAAALAAKSAAAVESAPATAAS